MLSYSGEENGVTTLRFYRKPNTNDQQNDVVIQVKNDVITLVMARSAFVFALLWHLLRSAFST